MPVLSSTLSCADEPLRISGRLAQWQRRMSVQLIFEFVATSQPGPLPDLWTQLNDEHRSAAVAVLARLIAQELKRREASDECS